MLGWRLLNHSFYRRTKLHMQRNNRQEISLSSWLKHKHEMLYGKLLTNTVEQGCKGKSLNFNQIYFNRVNSIRAMKGIRVLIFSLCVLYYSNKFNFFRYCVFFSLNLVLVNEWSNLALIILSIHTLSSIGLIICLCWRECIEAHIKPNLKMPLSYLTLLGDVKTR